MKATKTKAAPKCEHEVAESLVDALQAVNEAAVPVVTRDRGIGRKEQARLTRELFKSLGLKGISVTAPSYSMAQGVDVKIPRLQIHVANMWPHGGDDVHRSGCQVAEADRCPACRANSAVRLKVEEILARAFPNHDDRSDSRSDYFDYCWMIT